jgi:hypothetical protein
MRNRILLRADFIAFDGFQRNSPPWLRRGQGVVGSHAGSRTHRPLTPSSAEEGRRFGRATPRAYISSAFLRRSRYPQYLNQCKVVLKCH